MRDTEEFFVGYLPTPRQQRKFLIWACATMLGAIAGIAVIVGAGQRDPGQGVWDLSHSDEVHGLLGIVPYPMVTTVDGKTILLVSTGKHGIADRVAGLAMKNVLIQGHLLKRDAWTMLEVNDEATAVAIDDVATAAHAASTPSAPVVLRGQIIDPKCFLGAMKPGDGKAHKACATLCIRGGIPPALFTTNDRGQGVYYLLIDSAGRGLAGDVLEEIVPYIGDPIELSGAASQLGGVRLLTIDARSIRRI